MGKRSVRYLVLCQTCYEKRYEGRDVEEITLGIGYALCAGCAKPVTSRDGSARTPYEGQERKADDRST